MPNRWRAEGRFELKLEQPDKGTKRTAGKGGRRVGTARSSDDAGGSGRGRAARASSGAGGHDDSTGGGCASTHGSSAAGLCSRPSFSESSDSEVSADNVGAGNSTSSRDGDRSTGGGENRKGRSMSTSSAEDFATASPTSSSGIPNDAVGIAGAVHSGSKTDSGNANISNDKVLAATPTDPVDELNTSGNTRNSNSNDTSGYMADENINNGGRNGISRNIMKKVARKSIGQASERAPSQASEGAPSFRRQTRTGPSGADQASEAAAPAPEAASPRSAIRRKRGGTPASAKTGAPGTLQKEPYSFSSTSTEEDCDEGGSSYRRSRQMKSHRTPTQKVKKSRKSLSYQESSSEDDDEDDEKEQDENHTEMGESTAETFAASKNGNDTTKSNTIILLDDSSSSDTEDEGGTYASVGAKEGTSTRSGKSIEATAHADASMTTSHAAASSAATDMEDINRDTTALDAGGESSKMDVEYDELDGEPLSSSDTEESVKSSPTSSDNDNSNDGLSMDGHINSEISKFDEDYAKKPALQSPSHGATACDASQGNDVDAVGGTACRSITVVDGEDGGSADCEEEKKEDAADDLESLPNKTPNAGTSVVQIPTLTTLAPHGTAPAVRASVPHVASNAQSQKEDSTVDSVEIDQDDGRPINPRAVVCWACTIPLQRNPKHASTSDEDGNGDSGWGDQGTGLYSIHAHPLLQISVCSACSDKAYAVEDEALECVTAREKAKKEGGGDQVDTPEMEACSLCATEATSDEDGPLLFCCDRCPRTYCKRCVSVLNGGGEQGHRYVGSLMTSCEEEWLCPACETPAAVDEMQTALVDWSEEGEIVYEGDRQEVPNGNEPMSPETKSTAALIEDLYRVEDALTEAADMLENDAISMKREEIMVEIRKNRQELSEAELELEVDDELEGLIQQWKDHHSRLSETITTLQEALEVRNIDLAALYHDLNVNVLQESINEDVPNYAKEAEAELDRRDQEEGFSKGEFRGSSGYKMDSNVANLDVEDLDQSDINEIEDINTLEGTLAQLEHISNRNSADDRQCRWSKTDLTAGDISNMRKRALRRDDEELARLHIDIQTLERRGLKEEDDFKREQRQIRKETSRKKAGGTRINLNALSSVRKKKKLNMQMDLHARQSDAFSGVKRNREVNIRPVVRTERSTTTNASRVGGATTKVSKRRIVPQTLSAGQVAGTNRDAFSSSSAFSFSSLAAFDRYGDETPKTETVATLPYEESDLILARGGNGESLVSIVKPLAEVLKSHQVEGVKFLFDNTCSDLFPYGTEAESKHQVKGAVLAHNMGLGKSLQLCAFLHCFLASPAVAKAAAKKSSTVQNGIKSSVSSWHGNSTSSPSSLLGRLQGTQARALLCVPVNTIANWENEWSKWILSKEKGKAITQVPMYNLNEYQQQSRLECVLRWVTTGGVLLTSDRILSGLCKGLIPSSEKQERNRSVSFDDAGTDTGTSRSNSPVERYKDVVKYALLEPGPDVVCLDEGHTMLKNSQTNISKTLHAMTGCTRRIVLTGTPMQNNLTEYYRMAMWCVPSCGLGTEPEFDRKFTTPVMKGMNKDCSAQELFLYTERLAELQRILAPFVQRKGADILARDLPPLQQVVLNLRMSKMQAKLYRCFATYKRQSGVKNNFFDQYQKLRPINNHPATLLMPGRDSSKAVRVPSPAAESLSSRVGSPLPTANGERVEENLPPTGDIDKQAKGVGEAKDGSAHPHSSAVIAVKGNRPNDASGNVVANVSSTLSCASSSVSNMEDEKWWKSVYDKDSDFNNWNNGGKIILLLQILCHADLIGDKTVVFTQCLKTMDFIETVLQNPDWGNIVPAISTLSPGRQWGKWVKNRDYLRIDGATSASDRGDLVNEFNASKNSSACNNNLERQAKLFLISKEAGGVGINLHAANRVILFDSHWNPAVDLQAIYRCYRYGQTKPVFAYRFLTEGTMEEKIYSRSVNKSGLAARVIDQKHPERAFTSAELTDILATDTWVCCDLCNKWRLLPPGIEVDPEELEGEWYCDMNIHDKPRSRCDAKERDPRWYAEYFRKQEAKRLKRELARQRQQEKASQSQEIFGSQSQEPTLFESEMRDSIDARPKQDDPIKSRNTSRDVILRRLIYVAGGSKADHERDSRKTKKKKNHVTSWISKYHFHESLLKDCDKEAENLKSAAATGVRVADATEGIVNVTRTAAAEAKAPEQVPVTVAAAAPKTADESNEEKEEKEKEETNSPPPTPKLASNANKERRQTKPASSKNICIVTVKGEQNKKDKKRSRDELSGEADAEEPSSTAAESERPKKRPKASSTSNESKRQGKGEKSDGDVRVVLHHENGHDVLEIIDTDDEDDDVEDEDVNGVLV
eukprot:CAMPEP_0178490870 /NCGR_PEP_ID=MMETSP0696-20121128/11113_1 /TAXON_ID=265572 /ORGANISM="Extubocellulus spinifer, Strain CCMP396" /LENGTH=2342 /DNA_ID=CAMNT_0020118713 /DNA_START=453 /DNA_END=7481 /DNA_ORIENTATION=-